MKVTLFFVVQAVGRIILDWSVGRIMRIMLSFRVGASKNKNTNFGVKETYTNVDTTYISNQPHLFTPRLNNIKCTKFWFFVYFNVI